MMSVRLLVAVTMALFLAACGAMATSSDAMLRGRTLKSMSKGGYARNPYAHASDYHEYYYAKRAAHYAAYEEALAAHYAKVHAAKAACAAKRLALIKAKYGKEFLAPVAGPLAGAGTAVNALTSLLPPPLARANPVGSNALQFLLRGVLQEVGIPDILSLIGRLDNGATDNLGSLVTAFLSAISGAENEGEGEGEGLGIGEVLAGVAGLLGLPDLRNLNLEEALSGLMPIITTALNLLLSGDAEPGAGVLPTDINATNLIANLAKLVPEDN